jgi:hypothetical protein
VLVSSAAQGAAQGLGPDSVLIRNAPANVRRLLSITGLDQVIHFDGAADVS